MSAIHYRNVNGPLLRANIESASNKLSNLKCIVETLFKKIIHYPLYNRLSSFKWIYYSSFRE